VLPGTGILPVPILRMGQTEKRFPHLKAALPIDEEGPLLSIIPSL